MRHCHRQCGLFFPVQLPPAAKCGFTLVELLLVIVIIGVMSALIITTVSNAAQDTRLVVARQQQVTLQDALNGWVASSSSGTNTLQTARTAYSNASTSLAKLGLLVNYLHPETYSHLTNYSSSGQIKSEAMTKAGVYLQFGDWTTTNYPVVNMVQ
jgi:prepilin-type N-terminal cleavage/methylation domain-containing protein